MRLIDADRLLEEINDFSMRITGNANAMALTVMNETKKSIVKMIDEQPTAYDIDKCVEQLEDLEVHFDNDYFSNNKEEMLIKKEVFEIVKASGNGI